MNLHEQTLLDGALRSTKVLLVYGLASSEADTLSALTAGLKGVGEPLNLRGPNAVADGTKLREDVKARLAKGPSLVLLLPATANDTLRTLVAELAAGEIKIADQEPFKLGEEIRIVGLAPEAVPAEDLRNAFPLQVVGMKILDQARVTRENAEKELRAAQARARQSSIDHGLV